MNKQKLKIVLINKHVQDALGGSEIQCDIFARELTKIGFQVKYLAINGNKEKYETPYKVLPVKKNSSLIIEQIISENPDIVYWRYNKHDLYYILRKIKKENIKIIFAISHLNDVLKWGGYRRRVKGQSIIKYTYFNIKRVLLSRWNYRGFKYIDGVTTLNKKYLNKLPVDLQEYIPNSMNLETTDFSWHRPYVFWVANLKAQKKT
jgi:hypothetical protein